MEDELKELEPVEEVKKPEPVKPAVKMWACRTEGQREEIVEANNHDEARAAYFLAIKIHGTSNPVHVVQV